MEFNIRKLELEDIQAIRDIYKLITGDEAPDEEDLESRLEFGESMLCIGAEIKGKIVGFMFGHTERGSYGETETIGTIGLLGVHPDYRKHNVGRDLGNELINQFRGLGIQKIRTRVDNNDTGLFKFFMNLGLKPSNWTMLEYDN